MAASSGSYHEPLDRLQSGTIERHRAIVSLMEELEAIDWYDQRIDATGDAELCGVLEHNRDEEKEHAAMALEWLRRHDPVLDRHLRTYLFSPGSLVEHAEEEEVREGRERAADGGSGDARHAGIAGGGSDDARHAGALAAAEDGSLGIGSLRGRP
jgi:ferritin-like protein